MRSKPTLRLFATYLLVVLVGLLSLAIGLLCLGHPIVRWGAGIPRRSDAAPVLGVGLLVIPAVLVGLGIRRIWRSLAIDVAVVRQRRRRG